MHHRRVAAHRYTCMRPSVCFCFACPQALTWSVVAINTAFVWLALALLSLRQTGEWTVGQVSISVAILRHIRPARCMSRAVSMQAGDAAHMQCRLLSRLRSLCDAFAHCHWRACQCRPPDPCAACDASCAAAAAPILQSRDDHWRSSHGSPVPGRRLVWDKRLDQRARREGLVRAFLAAVVARFPFSPCMPA